MFEYSLVHWTTFLTAAVLLSLSPGPDIAYILGQTFRGGRRSGFAAMFGIWAGAFVHVVFAAVGLSAIIATSATAFSIIKWVGAAYLIYLGISALLSKASALVPEGSAPAPSKGRRVFLDGVLIAVLNPKVAVFFLAFLPQFVVEGAGPASAQLFLHGVLIIVVAAFIEPPLVLLGGRLSNILRESRTVGLWLERGMGAILVALGIRLALQDR